MRQQTLAEASFEKFRKPTKREQFLEVMDKVVPWGRLCALIEPVYPQADGAGRPPIGIERMLRIHFLQHWFNLSDPGMEEALYDSRAMRAFVGIDLGREPAPDETTLCRFRHLLEAHELGAELFHGINAHLETQGFKIATGTIVDATLIHAPASTKNRDKARDPDMHQTKKGNQWYFGMKGHIGVDSKTQLIHSVAATPANVHASQLIDDLLHGEETRVWGDSAYHDQREAIRARAPGAQDFTHKKAYRNQPLSAADQQANRTKSKVRARGEHPFHTLKCVFGFTKVRYRGLGKNANRLFAACGLINLYRVRRQLLALT
ncbi:MAG: IS5 family transposase [Nitrococcus sp.]|nr:IS5 family transposase [Nitrococcus sp.]